MKIIVPSFEIWAAWGHETTPYSYDRPYELIEAAARVCYKSEEKKTYKSAKVMVDKLIKNKHYAMLEHSWNIVKAHNGFASAPGRTNDLIVQLDGYNETAFYAGNLRAFSNAELDNVGYPVSEKQAKDSLKAMTVKFICDRGISHELVRHRKASFAQESTRYCNYKSKGLTFIIPPWVVLPVGEISHANDLPDKFFSINDLRWLETILRAEKTYQKMLKDMPHWKPEQARSILPNSLKTEVVITASLPSWKHIFKLRCAKNAHPQMAELMIPLRKEAKKLYPNFFKEM